MGLEPFTTLTRTSITGKSQKKRSNTHLSLLRVNFTGSWVQGEREGNGTTTFNDGAVYHGEYRRGLEHGRGFIRYPNGNNLDAEFEGGKIMGHGVFRCSSILWTINWKNPLVISRYANGDQREGFFKDNILEGQVIFTKKDGATVIEKWVEGKKIGDESLGQADKQSDVVSSVVRNEISVDSERISGRGGGRAGSWAVTSTEVTPISRVSRYYIFLIFTSQNNQEVRRLSQQARSRARNFLFDIFSSVQ